MPVKNLKTENSKLKTEIRKPKASASSTVRSAGLNVPVYSLAGTKKGTASLPKEIFGAKVNENLMAQAVRVYLVNQRQGTASTKTRGEVTASTRKIYRQKGTGRARHGAITAPIFRGGGIAFGPKPRNFELKLSKQMKKKALFSALSSRLLDEKIAVVDLAGLSGKTKEVASLFRKLNILDKRNKVLFVTDDAVERKTARNMRSVNVDSVHSINTYEVLNNNFIVLSKNCPPKMEEVFLKKD